MSLRIDTSEWISSSLIIGETGLGVLGQSIPSTGTNGESFLYNDLTLPDDNLKEIRALLLTYPTAGALTVFEDGSFQFVGAPDGTYTFSYQLYVDGVSTGSPATVTLNIGSAGVNLAASGAAASISTGSLSTGIKLAADAYSGAVTSATITTTVGLTSGAVVLTTTSASLNSAVQLSAQAVVNAVATSDITVVDGGNSMYAGGVSSSIVASLLTSDILMRCIAVARATGYASLTVGSTPSTPVVVMTVKFKNPNYKVTFK